VAVAAEVAVAEIVGEEDDDVGRARRLPGRRRAGENDGQEQQASAKEGEHRRHRLSRLAKN
jgi:hypothetical protein